VTREDLRMAQFSANQAAGRYSSLRVTQRPGAAATAADGAPVSVTMLSAGAQIARTLEGIQGPDDKPPPLTDIP